MSSPVGGRRTKVVATLGPASSEPGQIAALVAAGADVLRLNCSHLTTDRMVELIRRVRDVAPTTAVLVDVQGPKMRYAGPVVTPAEGEERELGWRELGFDGPAALAHVAAGHRVLVHDGKVELRVVRTDAASGSLRARVERAGPMSPGNGVNLPDSVVGGELLSRKDLDDLDASRVAGADWVAISFVQRPEDVARVRDVVGEGVAILAKIERPQALHRIDEICGVADAVMAARGDLGVELPYEGVPAAQHRIAAAAIQHGVVSVCATEMLESMLSSNRPTRAEVADVTAAVRDGFDAVMLSGETAVGADPVGAVRAMVAICEAADAAMSPNTRFAEVNPERAAVTAAAASLARRVGARLILALTYTGFSARLMAACRPELPIVAATPRLEHLRRLRLVRAVHPVLAERPERLSQAIDHALGAVRREHLVGPGDRVVVCASRAHPRSDADTVWLHTEP